MISLTLSSFSMNYFEQYIEILFYLQESAHLPNFAQISKIQYFFVYKFCLENYVAEIYIPEIMYINLTF
jgi:hypothetical protein